MNPDNLTKSGTQPQAKPQALERKPLVSKAALSIFAGLFTAGCVIGVGLHYWSSMQREATEWRVARALDTIPALESYLKKYPGGRFAEEAAKAVSQSRSAAQRAAEASKEAADWATAERAATKESYLRYLEKWPTGKFASTANRKISYIDLAEVEAKERADWFAADRASTRDAYRSFLEAWPSGKYASAANRKLRSLDQAEVSKNEMTDWAAADTANTREAYRSFLQTWPNGKQAATANQRLRSLDQAEENALWREAVNKGTRQAYEGYLEKFPNGSNAGEAKQFLSDLTTAVPLQQEAEARLSAGTEFRECPNCPTMVVLPAGSFTMGSPKSAVDEGNAFPSEMPPHVVKIAKPFAVGKFEVSFLEWDTCVTDGGCRGYRPGDQGWGRGKFPVMNVSWDDAKLYVRWLSRKTGKTYRLLSEAEWEYAARAGSLTNYHFGDDTKSLCRYANVADDSGSARRVGKSGFSAWMPCNDGYINSAPVGSLAPNAFQLHDMYGNVSEWVEDVWHDSYQGAPADGRAWTSDGDPQMRVGRGGSHQNLHDGVRSATRFKYRASTEGNLVGLRVARTLGP